MNPAMTTTLDLRDIHAAAPTGLWPPAPGWWVLAVVGLLALLFATRWLLRRLRLRRDRTQILAEIAAISTCTNKEQVPLLISNLSALLRRVALRRYHRERVAPLTGQAWLQFLDDTGGDGEFSRGAGRVLEDGAYKLDCGDIQLQPLLLLARHWVKQNLEVAA